MYKYCPQNSICIDNINWFNHKKLNYTNSFLAPISRLIYARNIFIFWIVEFERFLS